MDRTRQPSADLGRVLVTFTTRDRPGFSFLALSSLLAQTFEAWDLVVVDASEPRLRDYVEFKFLYNLMEQKGHRVEIVTDRRIGIPQAWQLGMERADSEFCQRLEDDTWPDPRYLERLYGIITSDENIAAVAGSNPNPFYPRRVKANGEIVKRSIKSSNGQFFPNILVRQGDRWVPTDGQGILLDAQRAYKVCHLHGMFMYRKSAVQEVGGFPTWMSRFGHREETELTLRLFFGGYDLLVCPGARLWHAAAPHGGSRDTDRKEALDDEKEFQSRVGSWVSEHGDMLQRVRFSARTDVDCLARKFEEEELEIEGDMPAPL